MKPKQGMYQAAIDWADFFDNAKIPVIGYDPINDQVIILHGSDYGATVDHHIYIYDMKTGSWTKCKNASVGDFDATNFVVNGAKELVIKSRDASTTTIYKWDSTAAASTAFKWKSKAFDFGSPGAKKKLYKISIHATQGDNTDVKIYYDGSTSAAQTFDAPLGTAAAMARYDLTVTTPTVFNFLEIEIYSDGSATPATFEINDIEFIYRTLSVH